MMARQKKRSRMHRGSLGFTLIEILIVVIILGILAAIVIPQFTNASQSARNSSVQSALQTIRSQMELFKLQHRDIPPAQTSVWTIMCTQSNTTDNSVGSANGAFGPYLQQTPVNALNGLTSFTSAAAANYGWVYSVGASGTYKIQALDTNGNAVSY